MAEGRCDSEQVFEASPEDLMWTPSTRAQHSRAGVRYGSDPTDAEWASWSRCYRRPVRGQR